MTFSSKSEDYDMREAKYAWHEESSIGCCKICLSRDEEPKYENIYTMYHGTTLEAAQKIIAYGFTPSEVGMLGKGVYVSRNEDKAASYPLKDKHLQVILELRVNVGKVKKIDYQGHFLQKTWHDHGYDTAWVPPGTGMVASDREEDCVWDPSRIQVIDVVKAPKISLPHLRELVKYHNRKKCLCGNEKPTDEEIYTMYHGTTLEAAKKIIAHGFKPSMDGLLGKGVYVSRDEDKAASYPRNEKDQQVILEVRVNVGKSITIDYQGHPLQSKWHDDGFDSAWIPAGCHTVNNGREEDCVWDPDRIQVIDVVKAPKNSLRHLQNLIQQHDPGFHKMALRNQKGKKNKNIHIMYHATTMTAAEQIIARGFNWSPVGIVGKGVYITRYANKATQYLLDNDDEKDYQVMLRLTVNVGNVLWLDSRYHPLKETWYKTYDTVWVSPVSGIVKGGLGDFCVRNPSRIKVVGIEEASERSLAHLNKLIKSGSCKKCPRRNKRSKNNKIYVINHGTTVDAAQKIITNGFQSSPDGVLGKGVYLYQYSDKPSLFPQDEDIDKLCQVMLELSVNIGKDITIDYHGHPLQTTWYKQYDTAFMPRGCAIVKSGLDEYCIRNPCRIKVIDILKAPGNSRVQLENLAEKYIPDFRNVKRK